MSNDIYAYLMQTNNHNRDTWEANGIGHLYPYGGKKDREGTAVTSSPDLPEAAIQQQVIDQNRRLLVLERAFEKIIEEAVNE